MDKPIGVKLSGVERAGMAKVCLDRLGQLKMALEVASIVVLGMPQETAAPRKMVITVSR